MNEHGNLPVRNGCASSISIPGLGMMDKLDLRVPPGAPFTSDFGRLYSELRQRGKEDPFHQSRLYHASGDLRPYGFDAILHMYCRAGEGNHKLELIDTGY